MTEQEIRRNAPSGATHYRMSRVLENTAIYFKLNNDKYRQFGAWGWSIEKPCGNIEFKPL